MIYPKLRNTLREVRRTRAASPFALMALAASGLIACAEDGDARGGAGEKEARSAGEAQSPSGGSSNAVPNDPVYPEQWHLPVIGAPAAWETTSGSPDVIVAVIDTGFDLGHPDFEGAIWTNPSEVPDGLDNDFNGLVDDVHGWSFVTNTPDVRDSPEHGTHVAGLIGAVKNNGTSVAGVASGVKLLPIAVPDSPWAHEELAAAIFYAVAQGARIINISMGGPEPYVGAREAIEYAVARDVLLISSAHNKSEDAYNHPAVYQEIVAVAATDPDDRRASLSNYGSWVDIAAPGQDVVSTFPGGGHLAVSGTSQAAPIVTGVAALIRSAHPDWTAEQVRTQLLATVDDIAAKNPDYVGLLGAGRVNAARAVGPAITNPLPYYVGHTSNELDGDGDQQPSAGDTVSVAVSWRFIGAAAAATAELVARDPFVTVTEGSVAVSAPHANRTHTARFTIRVAPDTPADHVADLRASVEIAGRRVERTIQLPVAPAYPRLGLRFGYTQVVLPHPSGRHLFVADDSPLEGAIHRVYAAFRDPDGSFTVEKTLSDPNNPARHPAATVDANGDAHVVYYQAVRPDEWAAIPGYSKYTAATGEWSTTTLAGEQIWARKIGGVARPQHPIVIARSPNGELHVAWYTQGALVLTKQVGTDWSEPKIFEYPSDGLVYPLLDLAFHTVGGRLQLFVHPVPTDITEDPPAPDFTRRLQRLEYDGAEWSAPIELGGADDENAQMPALLGDAVRRFQAPFGGGPVVLAELAGTSWNPVRAVHALDGAELESGFFGLETSRGVVTFLARPVPATRGSVRELWDGGVVHPLQSDSKRRAMYPVIYEDSGTRFVFNQERRIFRRAARNGEEQATFLAYPKETSFYTNGRLSPKARPSVPVVTDDGATTNDARRLHARWSSSHEAGIREYRVAWGTAPGLDDIVPWTVTTRTEETFDLGEQRLLPGQTVYASVEARSIAVLASAVGVSDGITLANPCVAPEWDPSIAYRTSHTRVTHRGATYGSLRPSSSAPPADSKDDWQLVMACEGTPAVPACKQPGWVPGRVYPTGSHVSHGGFELVSLSPNDTEPTGASENPWQWIRTCR